MLLRQFLFPYSPVAQLLGIDIRTLPGLLGLPISAEHPYLANTLRDVMELLGKMGI